MRTLLDEHLLEIETDENIRCVILKGAGNHFMAGGDVKSMTKIIEKKPSSIRNEFISRIHDLHSIMFTMRRMKKPIIASVEGAAAGAGVSMALACDLIIADEESYFTLAYCHIGTSPDGSGTFSLPRAVGIKKAMEIALLGEKQTAEDALKMGLINFIAAAGTLKEKTNLLASRLADGPTHVYGNTKHLLYSSLENQFESQLALEAEMFSDCASRQDFREGVTAFVEKRKPNFTGK